MSALRGFIAGTIVVSTVEVLVSSPDVAPRIGAAGDLLAEIIARVVDPNVPAIGKADFVKSAPLNFDQSNPAQAGAADGQPNAQGGVGSTPYGPAVPKRRRHRVLHSTKAKPPRVAPAPGRP